MAPSSPFNYEKADKSTDIVAIVITMREHSAQIRGKSLVPAANFAKHSRRSSVSQLP